MKPKTRYNISLAMRRGVEVKVHGMESLDIWYNLYKETAIRNSFMLHSLDYFKIILTEKANDTNSPAEVLLLIAEYDGNPLAAMFLVISDNRATYLYGASTSYRRNLMATYAVQWRAMTIAKERGCVEYDMFGVSPGCDESHPMHGLFRFKSGFGGELHHSMGCWDYPLDNEVYACYVAAEKSHQGYHV
jgi:lipid II:glycine glycyltransferase (peptidoglycan interpeptide bridge formation enzyme)